MLILASVLMEVYSFISVIESFLMKICNAHSRKNKVNAKSVTSPQQNHTHRIEIFLNFELEN